MNVTERTAAPPSTDRRQPRILVVDDEPSMRQMLSIVLRREGYEVSLAEHGRSAMAALPSPERVRRFLRLTGRARKRAGRFSPDNHRRIRSNSKRPARLGTGW